MSKLCQTLKASIFHEIRQSMAKSKHEFLKTYRLQQFGRSKKDFKSADSAKRLKPSSHRDSHRSFSASLQQPRIDNSFVRFIDCRSP